jgi:hypothetical protein
METFPLHAIHNGLLSVIQPVGGTLPATPHGMTNSVSNTNGHSRP